MLQVYIFFLAVFNNFIGIISKCWSCGKLKYTRIVSFNIKFQQFGVTIFVYTNVQSKQSTMGQTIANTFSKSYYFIPIRYAIITLGKINIVERVNNMP